MSTAATRVLVAFASRHGSTQDIAALIGSVLTEGLASDGVVVHVARVEDVDELGCYDAAVIGSAVYLGRWLKPAREFMTGQVTHLTNIPTWLFSSGPVGDPPRPAEESQDSLDLAELVGARDHVVFSGRLDKSELRLAERVAVRLVGADSGDFRDTQLVVDWATAIARQLRASSGAPDRLFSGGPKVPPRQVIWGQPHTAPDETMTTSGPVPSTSQVRQS